jgi:hypothetical protein
VAQRRTVTAALRPQSFDIRADDPKRRRDDIQAIKEQIAS